MLKVILGGFLITTLGVVVLFLTVSCGAETPPTPTPAPVLSDVLTKAGERMAAISSAKFRIVDEKETGAKFFETTFKSLEAEVKTPDSFRMWVDVVSPAFGFVEVQMMAVGDQAFIKFSENALWADLAPEGVPFNFREVGKTLRDVIYMVRDGDGAITGTESVQGAQTILVEGTVQSERLSNLITSVDSGYTVTLTMWIDESDYTMRQLRLAGRLYNDDGLETTRMITIDAIDVPIEIEIPDLGSGQ